MAVRKVLKMGDPLLYQRAEEVRRVSYAGSRRALIRDMFDTMVALNGAGLAAPQIGVSQRKSRHLRGAIQYALPRKPRRCHVPSLINPVLEPIGGGMDDGWEGCLSVPGLRGLVSRYKSCVIRASTRMGKPIDRMVSGLPCPRGTARMRSPRRHPLSHAPQGHPPACLVSRSTVPRSMERIQITRIRINS